MKTGWPPSLLMQDDDSRLSRWFASRPDARYTFRKNIMENKEIKSYQLTIYSTVTKLHTVQASSVDEARAMGYDIMSPLETGDVGSDPHWKQIVTYVQELPYTLRDLTLEDVAFVDAYCSAVAVAPRAEVVRYVATDPEYRSEREFYDSMSEYYTSIADAHEVWYQAMQFAKEFKK